VSYHRSRLTPGGTRVDTTLVWSALCEAAERAASTLASVDRRPIRTVRDELQPVIQWVDAMSSDELVDGFPDPLPPRRYIEALKQEFLDAMGNTQETVDARLIVPVIRAFEDLQRTAVSPSPANQFTQHLASDNAMDAVIEIAHDMRSPLSSILFLVDTIRRGQSGSLNAVQERQLGIIYGAAFGLSSLASDAIDAVRGHRLLDG
jgi:signal transduction histidine kinase